MTELRIPGRAAAGLGATALAGTLALALTFPSARTLGLMFESDGQVDAATQYLQAWGEKHPIDFDSRLHAADLMVQTVHPEQAILALTAMDRDWPNQPRILERLVDIEDSLLRVDEAAPYLERLAKASPRDRGVLHRLADYYRWKGRTEPLLATLVALTRIDDAPDERAELTDMLLASRRYDDLIAWLLPLLDGDDRAAGLVAPAAVDLRVALYEAYLRTGRMDEAAAELARILELAPDRVDLVRPVAEHLVERGLFDQAVALYRERIDRLPRGGHGEGHVAARAFAAELNELYETHAEHLARTGHVADAIALYRRRIAAAPLDVPLRLELAELYGARATEVAVAELRQVVGKAPRSVEAWLALAERYSWQERLGPAVAAYQHALQLAPDNREVRRQLAQHLIFMDRVDEGVAQYRLLAATGDDLDREALVDLLLDEERGEEAMLVAEKLTPSPRHRYLQALAAHAAGDDEAALPGLAEWTRVEPSNVKAWQALCDCATAVDEPDVALQALRHLQALGRRAGQGARP